MSTRTRKSQGFAGERIMEIPRDAVEKCRSMPLINHLYITRMGFYPKALHHYYQRPAGIYQVILLYCTDGKGWIQLPNSRIALGAGEVFAIAPGIPHSYGADAENPWTIHWFHLGGNRSGEAVNALLHEQTTPSQALRVGFSEERTALFDRIFDTFLKGYSTANLLYANLATSFFLASLIQPENFGNAPVAGAVVNATSKAIQYMQQHVSESVTLDNIARAAHLSTSFFCRKFKRDTGYAPIAYFNHLRIQKACQLLHFSNLRINEVAAQIGIDDPFYFSRLFKKQLGVSPVEYRKSEGIGRAAR